MSDALRNTLIAIGAILALWLVFWFIVSENPETPAGYVGYVTQGALFGKAEFYCIQHGPASPGRAMFLHAVHVSITPYTYNESFQGEASVLSQDNLKVGFNVFIVWKAKDDDGSVHQFVEKFSTLDARGEPEQVVATAYNNYIKEPLRTYARVEVQRYKAFDIKSNMDEIGQVVEKKVRKLAEGTPFDIISVVVGNITYDTKVTDAISEKLATAQNSEKYTTLKEIETKKAEIRVIEANGIAKAMEVIQSKLTPMYLQHEAVEAQKAMVGSPNHTTIYIPVGPMGLPIVQTLPNGQSK